MKLLQFRKQRLAAVLMSPVAIVFIPSALFSRLALDRSKSVGNEINEGVHIPSNFLAYGNQATPGNDGKWCSVVSSLCDLSSIPATFGLSQNDPHVSGVYFYRIDAGNEDGSGLFTSVKKLVNSE